ncbi:MAG: DNA repair protein RadA [Candidatus Babeliaceae bacterium]|nr:DNA repair protein RadA [Candidatus Babeliaceae bacterium]
MSKTTFVCLSCQATSSKWFGCCPVCHEWNTIEEVSGRQPGITRRKQHLKPVPLQRLNECKIVPQKRLASGIGEWDRVTGGGIVSGSFLMLTGDPGIGKSTLLLHIAHELSKKHRIFYFSSEESLEQVKLRAERINCVSSTLLFSDRAQLDEIIITAEHEHPDIIIIDSIQNCYSSESETLPGSVGQLREAAFRLMRLAKENGIAVILSGHITKEGLMAGPKTLEHMVDAVFYLQGEDRWQTRILRSVKNRFGTVNEIGFFEMETNGLREITNINKYLIDECNSTSGSMLASSLEGSRPLLLELQALTIPTQYGVAQRVISGIDPKHVILVAAILEKYLHIKFSAHDIFFKISGSLKIKGVPPDLGIALALLSSFFQQPLPAKCIALGELSLTGQVKPINGIGIHTNEAEKFGIRELFIASNQKIAKCTAQLHRFKHVGELLSLFN